MGTMIATPMRSRSAWADYVVGLMNSNGLHAGWMPMFGQSDVYVARNTLINQWYKTTQHENLVFIDSDIGFTRENLQDLIATPGDLVSGLYPGKGDEPEWVFRDEDMEIVPFNQVPKRGMLVSAAPGKGLLLGCGFLKITRHCLDAMILKGNVTPYGFVDGKNPNHQFFRGIVHRNNLLSEDYSFSVLAIEAGIQPAINCGIRLTHEGRSK
jgi:hypothetical protein